MKTLNLGILAHVDAGKTSLTERLLYTAGVIDELGSVDRGNTQTDSLALERQRGITIKSAVASFPIGDITVNLIDTPGHPDFIAEVERVLSVLDGAVLVISAVEGIQAQTRVLMRALRRLRIPTLIFINKIDRTGARPDAVLRDIAEKLAPNVAPMDVDLAEDATLIEVLAENSDAMLSAYLNDETAISRRWLRRELADQTRRALVLPIFFGSAITGAGVDSLMSGIARLLPTAQADAEGPVSGTVFKKDGNPFLATVGLRLDPAPPHSGFDFRMDVAVESMPLFIFKAAGEYRAAVEETIRQTLQQGIYGWQVTDCVVTMTHSGYTSPGSTPADFRKLIPLVLMSALKRAGTVVCEPIHRFRLDAPADTLPAVMRLLASVRGVPQNTETSGATVVMTGDIPAARVHWLQQRLPSVTRGEGALESAFHHYVPVLGEVPSRPRSDQNPLNRKEYLLHVLRRV